MISMIAAQAENRVIGNKNTIPWHLPADFKYFKETTLGKTIVLGLNTFKSIGEKFEEIRTEFKIECKQIRDEFKSELDPVKKDIMEIKISVAKLEDRTDERVFKVIHVEGTGTSK